MAINIHLGRESMKGNFVFRDGQKASGNRDQPIFILYRSTPS